MYTFSFVDCREQEHFNTYRNEFDSKPWWMTRLITMFLKTHTNRPHIVSNQTRIWYVVFIFWFLVVILVPFIDSISAYQTKICIITKHIIYFSETRHCADGLQVGLWRSPSAVVQPVQETSAKLNGKLHSADWSGPDIVEQDAAWVGRSNGTQELGLLFI